MGNTWATTHAGGNGTLPYIEKCGAKSMHAEKEHPSVWHLPMPSDEKLEADLEHLAWQKIWMPAALKGDAEAKRMLAQGPPA